jgi:short-subunit dehydrogenase
MAAGKPITLITGASAGIGAALAHEFAICGHELVLVARRAPQLGAVADAVASRTGARPHVIALDLAQHDAGARLGAMLTERGLEPQFVVNNAGFGFYGLAADLDRAGQLAMIDVNVRVLTDLSLRFSESLVRHKGGILNVASLASFMPGPGMAVYHATKAYVLSFSEALSRELAPQGVRVTALCPGPVPTEFQALAGIPKGAMPAILTVSAAATARQAYDGLMRGRRVVMPGLLNRLLGALPRFLPRALVLAMIEIDRRSLIRKRS